MEWEKRATNHWKRARTRYHMQLNEQTRMIAAGVFATALAGAVLMVHAECSNSSPSGNDAETACHNCATGEWSTGSCTWHEAEAGEPYCGECAANSNCGGSGTPSAQKVTTYRNGMCSATGCMGGDAQTDPQTTVQQSVGSSCAW